MRAATSSACWATCPSPSSSTGTISWCSERRGYTFAHRNRGAAMNVVERAKNLLLQPKVEWPVIDAEPHTVQGLYTQYIMILAAIGPVAAFIGYSLIGISGFG